VISRTLHENARSSDGLEGKKVGRLTVMMKEENVMMLG
jgi:hypothetical protein